MSDDLSKLSGEMYRQWEKSMSAWWDQVLESPAFLSMMGDSMAWQSRMRRDWEDQVDTTMSRMHLPSRKDVIRLARVASLLEDRILGLEDRLLEMSDQLGRVEAETLKARVDAAEALVTVQERLEAVAERLEGADVAAIRDQLTAIEQRLAGVSPPPPRRTRGKKPEGR